MSGGTLTYTGARNGSQINGTPIANNFTSGGELHSYAFTGSLPSVPEPSAIMTFAGGVAWRGAMRAPRDRWPA
jgi:hypothetical protein